MTSIAGADWLRAPELRAVFAALVRDGDSVRAVGGAVRNTLRGLPVKDVDLATTALPDAVTARAVAAGLKAIPTGIEHGTITVVSGGVPFEVTTLRADIETDGRRAIVRFGTDWAVDAARRDFTMNALYAGEDGTVLDPVGGMDDCLAGRVRFIGDAATRIREDRLRILRFFRFHAAYGSGAIDAAGLGAAIRERHGLSGLSRERIGQEMRRLLVAPGAAATAALMQESGILGFVLAGVGRPGTLGRLKADEAWLRLAALGAFVEDDAERLSERLRLSNAETRGIALATRLARTIRETPEGVRAAVFRHGNDAVVSGLQLRSAVEARPSDPTLMALAADWRPPGLPVTAGDLIAAGLKPGPALGAALRRAEEAWIASDFRADRELLLRQ